MKYKLVEKGNPAKPEEPKKWYANPVNEGKITESQLAKKIAGRSSLTAGDISNVIKNLIDEMPEYLMMGKSVNLEDFGTFRLSFSSEGAEKKKDFKSGMIKNMKIIFTPSVALKTRLTNEISFQVTTNDE